MVIDYSRLRQQMVDIQIRARGVRDVRALQAVAKVPRHEFVPGEFRHQAYDDNPLPIGQGQTISQPYMVAVMTEALLVQEDCRVLEIGTGSGYQTAVLAELAARVYSVEIVPELSSAARRALQRSGYRNVRLRVGNGYDGWVEFAPYDRIIVTAGAEAFPFGLAGQLREGGRIVVPVGRGGAQTLTLGVRHGGRVVQRALMGCVFVPFVRERTGGESRAGGC